MLTRPVNSALAAAWIIFGVFMIARFTNFWTTLLGALSIAIGVAMLGSPPEK